MMVASKTQHWSN